MKKVKFFSMVAVALATGVVACNNDSEGTASADSLNNANNNSTAATTVTTSGDYAALADSARINSEAGNYLDARTGQPIRINVDPQTGMRTNAQTGEPVWRYVDKRTWWVYGGAPDAPTWNSMGEARMQGSKIEFKDSNNAWVDYDRMYKDLDVKNGEEWKMKSGDTKIKVEKDGDMKIKTPDGKYKVESDGDTKLKTDDVKIKKDEDGTKVKDNK